MKITLIAVGRVKGPLADAVHEYEERAARYWKLQAIEVDPGAPRGQNDVEVVRQLEEERILARTPENADLVALSRLGQPVGSRAFAAYLQDHALHRRDVTFVIGGAYGLGARLLSQAWQLTLSPMTFPHEVARMLLAEQLYRAGTILRGEPYHKGP